MKEILKVIALNISSWEFIAIYFIYVACVVWGANKVVKFLRKGKPIDKIDLKPVELICLSDVGSEKDMVGYYVLKLYLEKIINIVFNKGKYHMEASKEERSGEDKDPLEEAIKKAIRIPIEACNIGGEFSVYNNTREKFTQNTNKLKEDGLLLSDKKIAEISMWSRIFLLLMVVPAIIKLSCNFIFNAPTIAISLGIIASIYIYRVAVITYKKSTIEGEAYFYSQMSEFSIEQYGEIKTPYECSDLILREYALRGDRNLIQFPEIALFAKAMNGDLYNNKVV